MPDDTHLLLKQIYQLADNRDMDTLIRTGDDDFSFSVQNLSRFRVSAFKQRGSLSAVIRVISFELPDRRERHIPERIINLADYSKGLVLVTGPAGNGKSTTLACIIDHINHTQEKHIITLEDRWNTYTGMIRASSASERLMPTLRVTLLLFAHLCDRAQMSFSSEKCVTMRLHR